MKCRNLVLALFAAGMCSPLVFAQKLDAIQTIDGAAEVTNRYPAGSITTTTNADDALRDIKRERAAIELQHKKSGEACTSKFFTNHCLDQARENRRASLAQLRQVEVEANAFKRRAKATAHDENIAIKQTKAQEQGTNAPISESALPEASGTAHAPRPASSAHGVKPSTPKPLKDNSKILAKQEKSAIAYDKKLADSQERQEAIAKRKAESEQKRLKKQAAQAKSVNPGMP